MSDIEADAKLDVGQVLQGLRLMTSELNNATLAMKKLNDQGDKTKRTLKDNLKDAGSVAGKAGGPVGSFSSKLLSGASMDGVFGRMAVGLSVASLAARAFTGQVDAAIEKSRLLLKVQDDIRQANEKTKNELNSIAAKGEAQAAGRTNAIANGGASAANDIDMVTGAGVATQEQANEGVATLYGRFGNTKRTRNAVDIAMRGAMGGLPFDEVSTNLTQMGAAVDNNDQVDRMLGRMSQEKTGRVGDPKEIWLERMRNLNADTFIMKARKSSAQRSEISGIERDTFMKESPVSNELMAANPKSKNDLELFNRQEKEVSDLASVGKAAREAFGGLGVLAEALKNFNIYVGGSGSLENQLRLLQLRQAEAQGLPTNDSTPPPPKPIFNLTQGQPFGGGR